MKTYGTKLTDSEEIRMSELEEKRELTHDEEIELQALLDKLYGRPNGEQD